ncbi:GNAT family N-acetyltransferase [Methylocapsa sp. S129]|uniref:GNAT family N-acetyltransferase n=1 Tax=Methylocapsa sp. S129 TaxID=1641869 RepID=UPI00131B9824|nr:GNAT family N-acetyltransferase [Methylocapsa sp. S129]
MKSVLIRAARSSDLPAIIALIANDQLGRQRDDASLPLHPDYSAAFQAIEADPNQWLVVAVIDDRIIGTLQLSFIPGLARRGAWRGQIEAVRIAADCRNAGLGRQMMDWAIAECRSRGCALVQLTTDKSRPDAHRFYERLGFKASHEGYKLAL